MGYMMIRDLCQSEIEQLHKWLDCKQVEYPPSHSACKPGITFWSDKLNSNGHKELDKDQLLDLTSVQKNMDMMDMNTVNKPIQEVPLDLRIPSRHSPRLAERKAADINNNKQEALPVPMTKQEKMMKGSLNTARGIQNQCGLCRKTFKECYNLNKDMQIHSGKLHKCKNCAYSARSPYHLKEHEEKCIHGVMYQCTAQGCTAVFKHCSAVYRHAK